MRFQTSITKERSSSAKHDCTQARLRLICRTLQLTLTLTLTLHPDPMPNQSTSQNPAQAQPWPHLRQLTLVVGPPHAESQQSARAQHSYTLPQRRSVVRHHEQPVHARDDIEAAVLRGTNGPLCTGR